MHRHSHVSEFCSIYADWCCVYPLKITQECYWLDHKHETQPYTKKGAHTYKCTCKYLAVAFYVGGTCARTVGIHALMLQRYVRCAASEPRGLESKIDSLMISSNVTWRGAHYAWWHMVHSYAWWHKVHSYAWWHMVPIQYALVCRNMGASQFTRTYMHRISNETWMLAGSIKINDCDRDRDRDRAARIRPEACWTRKQLQ